MPNDARGTMLECISIAIEQLSKASTTAKHANQLAESVPLVQEIDKIAARLNMLMQEAGKLRGLG